MLKMLVYPLLELFCGQTYEIELREHSNSYRDYFSALSAYYHYSAYYEVTLYRVRNKKRKKLFVN